MMVITTSSSMSVKPGRVEKLERGLSFMIFGWVCVGRVPGTKGVRKNSRRSVEVFNRFCVATSILVMNKRQLRRVLAR
jgi:hypothetical protein